MGIISSVKKYFRILLILLAGFALLYAERAVAAPVQTDAIKDCLPVRALQLSIINGKDIEYYKGLIALASENNFNIIIIKDTGFVSYPDMPIARGPYLTPKQVNDIIAYAKSLGLEVIPNVELFTHQEMITKKYMPELLLNPVTIDMKNPRSWEFEKMLLDRAIEAYKPAYVHIGHDELWGYNSLIATKALLSKGWKRPTPEEFVDHIILVHDYLKSKNIRTIIWGDMFMDIDVFYRYYGEKGVKGTAEFAALLDRLPRDIIIGDWHYDQTGTGFPSFDFFKKKGFTVWGATWLDTKNIKLFSEYVRARAQSGDGMISTLWHYSWNEDKYRDAARRTIIDSGKAFCPGPPAK